MKKTVAMLALASVVLAAGCTKTPAAPAKAQPPLPTPVTGVNAADFGGPIDNPYLPLTPGTKFRFEGKTDKGLEVIEVEVTGDTREILGVKTVTVKDTVTLDGKLIEDTLDWYARDKAGNVWYFGEATKEYENGKVTSTAGSWEAGVGGAVPGISMYASPRVGQVYRQEYFKGEAEDAAQILSVNERVKVRFGSFDQAVKTFDFTPLQPDMVEHKNYAKGVGLILITGVNGEEPVELVSVSKP